MNFKTFFKEAVENPDMEVEQKDEFDPKEIEIGMKEEKEHSDIYDLFKSFADDNKLEMPLSEEDFYLTIIKAHLKEDDKYYSKLVECMKKDDTTN